MSPRKQFWKLQKKGDICYYERCWLPVPQSFKYSKLHTRILVRQWGYILRRVGVFNSLISMAFSLMALNTFLLLFIKSETPFPFLIFFLVFIMYIRVHQYQIRNRWMVSKFTATAQLTNMSFLMEIQVLFLCITTHKMLTQTLMISADAGNLLLTHRHRY